MEVIQVVMEEDLLQRLSREARARRLTPSALIREACKHYLETFREDELDRQYTAGYRRHPKPLRSERLVKDSRRKYGPARIGNEARGLESVQAAEEDARVVVAHGANEAPRRITLYRPPKHVR